MIGVELSSNLPALAPPGKPVAPAMVERLHQAGLLVIPSGSAVLRLLPALNLTASVAQEGLALLNHVVAQIDPG